MSSYLNQVHLREAFQVPRLLDIEYGDDVLVVEVAKKLHLSKRTETEHRVIERCDFLDSNLLA